MRLAGWVIGLFFVYLLVTGKLSQFVGYATTANPVSSGPGSSGILSQGQSILNNASKILGNPFGSTPSSITGMFGNLFSSSGTASAAASTATSAGAGL